MAKRGGGGSGGGGGGSGGGGGGGSGSGGGGSGGGGGGTGGGGSGETGGEGEEGEPIFHESHLAGVLVAGALTDPDTEPEIHVLWVEGHVAHTEVPPEVWDELLGELGGEEETSGDGTEALSQEDHAGPTEGSGEGAEHEPDSTLHYIFGDLLVWPIEEGDLELEGEEIEVDNGEVYSGGEDLGGNGDGYTALAQEDYGTDEYGGEIEEEEDLGHHVEILHGLIWHTHVDPDDFFEVEEGSEYGGELYADGGEYSGGGDLGYEGEALY